MGVINRLKSAFGSGEEQAFEYECAACGETFELAESHMAKVSCAACGSSDVRTLGAV